ncbi:MAG: hypothetical protein HWN65_03675 [Candidatus Helarchaeota archaeon]|nr:hypothetical protein [Candidatus Helarchaeota archaeon]
MPRNKKPRKIATIILVIGLAIAAPMMIIYIHQGVLVFSVNQASEDYFTSKVLVPGEEKRFPIGFFFLPIEQIGCGLYINSPNVPNCLVTLHDQWTGEIFLLFNISSGTGIIFGGGHISSSELGPVGDYYLLIKNNGSNSFTIDSFFTQISMDTSFYISFVLVMVGGLIILCIGLFLRAHSLPWKGEKREPNE